MTKALRFKLRGDEAGMMSVIADGFVCLGGVYVKFLQGVLLQIPAMSQWKSQRRFDVYENVQPHKMDIMRVLGANFAPEILGTIEHVDPAPFAAGSFGQVHRATLKNQEHVVIKALRQGARKTLKKDLRLVQFVARLIAGSISNFSLDLRSITKDFVQATLHETDYKAEAAFAVEYYEAHVGSNTIVVPKTYTQLCSSFIITQEYIEGVSIAQLLRASTSKKTTSDFAEAIYQTTGSNLTTQLKHLGIELHVAALEGRALHGDPHPGNIRLLADNKVALLDYGIRARPSASPGAYFLMLKEWWRAEYVNEPDPGAIFLSYIRFYSEKLYTSMRIVSDYASQKYSQKIQLDTYLAELGNSLFNRKVSKQMLQKGMDNIRSGRSAADISVMKIINQDNRFQITAHLQDGPVMRSLVTYNSLVTELGQRQVIPEVYESVMRYVHANLPQLEEEYRPAMGLSDAVETLNAWLERLANSDYELFSQISLHFRTLISTAQSRL